MQRAEARQRLDDLVSRYLGASARAADPQLTPRIRALARFQAQRLAATYADLRQQSRYRAAVDFFLTDLYGPQDLLDRDRQVLRALDKLKRYLPAAALDALAGAFELHVLTIELDTETAGCLLGPAPVDAAGYAEAYRHAGRRSDRDRQIQLIGLIGALLDGLARHPEVGLAIRLARAPAHAAGYGQLQDFLERGYAAFRALDGAAEFLAIVDQRERRLMQRMFAGSSELA